MKKSGEGGADRTPESLVRRSIVLYDDEYANEEAWGLGGQALGLTLGAHTWWQCEQCVPLRPCFLFSRTLKNRPWSLMFATPM